MRAKCRKILPVCLAATWMAAVSPVPAQGSGQDADLGWGNATEFSVVFTQGNSETESFAFRNTLSRRSEVSRFELVLDSTVANSADDRFLLVEPGVTWEPGAQPPPASARIEESEMENDAERYLADGRYERNVSDLLFWVSGGSWERNVDAGILNRYVAYGGVGHTWRDREELMLRTFYGLSFTERDEEEPDPEKDSSFLGVRAGWRYRQRFGEVTKIENEFVGNSSTKDFGDYTAQMTTSLSVSMNRHLALKTSLQWTYNNQPALQEVDLVARVVVVDPNGNPGDGDEYFQTVGSGGFEAEVGDADIRKEQLDTIFRTTLVINF